MLGGRLVIFEVSYVIILCIRPRICLAGHWVCAPHDTLGSISSSLYAV